MLHTLENGKLKITVADHGAELKSITGLSDGTEYLFDSNPEWWKYSSPVLFPIVGKLENGKFRADGKEYEMPAHGFARVSDFECVREESDEVVFQLKWNEETLKNYPYKFLLEIAYVLKENRVEVIWTVKNLDDREIYFSIGAHPAIKCPIVDGENFEDCYLKFNVAEKSGRIPLTANGTFTHEKTPLLDGFQERRSYFRRFEIRFNLCLFA